MKKIPVAAPDLSGNEVKYLIDAIKNEGRVSSAGKYIDRFEVLAAKNFGRKFALSCSSGTTALHLALLALGIGPGDEVIVPVFTFAAPAAVVIHCGAKLVFVDINKNDWNLDVKELDKKLTKRTKALIAVDTYGMPCDYDYIVHWCKAHKIFLIEDAAESHGAFFGGKPVGNFGEVSCFSFYGNKILTTGEGGVCLSDSQELYEKMAILKNHGMRSRGVYDHEVVGYNYRMTNLQAAVGCAQFERFQKFLKARKTMKLLYEKLLANCPSITFQLSNDKKAEAVCWLFSVLINKDIDAVRQKLSEKGVASRPFFKPLHLQKPFQPYAMNQKFPNAEYAYQHGISLPSSTLLTEKQVSFICRNFKRVLADE
ncbi:MAG: DegT/DnrJ/EryC1/StrS aminotransferase family protein [bacterium]